MSMKILASPGIGKRHPRSNGIRRLMLFKVFKVEVDFKFFMRYPISFRERG
jgi:hypothetical protein